MRKPKIITTTIIAPIVTVTEYSDEYYPNFTLSEAVAYERTLEPADRWEAVATAVESRSGDEAIKVVTFVEVEYDDVALEQDELVTQLIEEHFIEGTTPAELWTAIKKQLTSNE